MTQLTRSVAGSDSHLVQVLDRYLAALQTGNLPDKAELLAQYPELADDLEACLASLEFIRAAAVSADSREVIILRSIEERDWDEVAEKMGRSQGAVRLLWARALKRLRPLIESRL